MLGHHVTSRENYEYSRNYGIQCSLTQKLVRDFTQASFSEFSWKRTLTIFTKLNFCRLQESAPKNSEELKAIENR